MSPETLENVLASLLRDFPLLRFCWLPPHWLDICARCRPSTEKPVNRRWGRNCGNVLQSLVQNRCVLWIEHLDLTSSETNGYLFFVLSPPPYSVIFVYTEHSVCLVLDSQNNSNNFTEPLWGSVVALVLTKATTWLKAGIRIAFQRSEGVCGMNGKGNGTWKGRYKKRGWVWNMLFKCILVGETRVETLLIN